MRKPSSPADTKRFLSSGSDTSEDAPPSYDDVISGIGGLHVAGAEESPKRHSSPVSPSAEGLPQLPPASPRLAAPPNPAVPEPAPRMEERTEERCGRRRRGCCSKSRNSAAPAPPVGLCSMLGWALGDVRRNLAAAQADVQRNLADARADVQRNLAEARADVQRNLLEADASVRRDLADARRDIAVARRDVDQGLAQASRSISEGFGGGGCGQRRARRCGGRRNRCG